MSNHFLNLSEFKIPQIPFAFESECERPNGNSVTFHQIWGNQSNGRIAIQQLFVTKLPFGR